MNNIKLSYLDLLSPEDIAVEGLGRFKKPTLRQIASPEVGYEKYNSYLTFFLITPEVLLDAIYEKGTYAKLKNEVKNELTTFDLLTEYDFNRDGLQEAISFFIDGKCEWDKERRCFLINAVKGEGGKILCDGCITKENFYVAANVILQIAHTETKVEKPQKFQSERARKAWEAAEQGKKKREKARGEAKMLEIPNVVSKLATYHNSLNMLNIWDLTVYQLYDQFTTQNQKNQTDIGARNYSVWGGDKFDVTAWFKNLNEKGE